jgi:hypothetical protein
MATPLYDALAAKVRDWAARRETATVPETVVDDCIQYGMDDIYRLLRVPQLEYTAAHTIVSGDQTFDKYSFFDVPSDHIETIYIGKRNAAGDALDYVYNQYADQRTFLDPFAEQYSRNRYAMRDNKFLIHPKLTLGDIVELNYYRKLTSLFYLDDDDITVIEPADHWLRDSQEQLIIFSSLKYMGIYLVDDAMEAKYEKHAATIIAKLNNEEKMRRARGGNVQMNVNTGGLI